MEKLDDKTLADLNLIWTIEAQCDAIQQHSLVLVKVIRKYLEKKGIYKHYQNKRYKKKHRHSPSLVLKDFFADPEKALERIGAD